MSEYFRKIAHVIFGFFLLVIVRLSPTPEHYLLLLTIFGIILSLLSLQHKIPVIEFFLQKFDRAHDRNTLPGKGALFFAFGALVVTILFQKNIASASIAILTFGDPIAQLVGTKGRWTHAFNKQKKWEGTFAGIICATAAAMFFVPFDAAIIAAVFAMIAEALPLPIDDNLHVPFIAAVVLALVL